MTRYLVVQHEDSCPPEWLGAWWAERGVHLDVRRGHRGDPIPEVLEHDGLLVLGGDMDCDADDTCPWLAPTRELIKRTISESKPFLGVCLGYQMATLALGGKVGRNPHGLRVGVTPVTLTEAGEEDVLFGGLPDDAPAVHWNRDIATKLPYGTRLLATAPDGTPQIVRFDRRAWGVQFHPEMSPALFRRWSTDKPESEWPEGVDVVARAKEVDEAAHRLARSWSGVCRRFVEIAHS